MANLAFLLAPLRDIPDTRDDRWMAAVCGWQSAANWRWFELYNELPQDRQTGVPRMPPGASLSKSAMDAGKDPRIVASAKAWAEQAWTAWHASGRTAPVPVVDTALAHETLDLDSRIS